MSSSYLTMCISCKEQVRPRQEGLQCDGCLRWQHRTCHTGVSQADYRNAVKTGASIDWRCLTCDFPQAESSLSILSTDILESKEFNPPADSSDQLTEPSTIDTSSESAVGIEGSTVHEPPIQPTIDESTIEGPTPQAVEEVDQPLTFQIMEGASERGKRKLIDSNGFSYNVKRQRLEATDWQCTVRPTVRCFCHLKGLGHGI